MKKAEQQKRYIRGVIQKYPNLLNNHITLYYCVIYLSSLETKL
jgi:hypothetical protein